MNGFSPARCPAWIGIASLALFGLIGPVRADSAIDLFTTGGSETGYSVTDQGPLAGRFEADKEFNQIQLKITDAKTDSAVTIALYQWRGQYDQSVTDKTKKLVQQSEVDIKTSGWLTYTFPVQKAGTYIWTATAIDGKSDVSIGGYDASAYLRAQGYLNGTTPDTYKVWTGGGSAENLGDTKTNAQMFVAEQPFNEIRCYSPAWNDETGTKGYTLTLYAWKDDYDTSVAGTALATKYMTNFKDNAWVSMWFGIKPAGNYLWVASDPVKPPIGHWADPTDIIPDGQGFTNGQETSGDFPMGVVYTASGTDADLDFEARYVPAVNVGTVKLTGPIADATVTDNPPTLQWEALPNATSYTVQWSQDNNFGADLTSEAKSDTTSLKLPKAISLGRWFWRVKATTPTADSDYTSDSLQLTAAAPVAGGDVVLEDFENADDWVERALTLETETNTVHAGSSAMKVDFAAVHCFAAVDSPIGRVLPKNPDGLNPEKVFLWTYVDAADDGELDLIFNVSPSGSQFSVPLDLSQAGAWTKQDIDLTQTAASDSANTISLFSIQRPTDFAGTASSVLFDDFGATYAASSTPAYALGDINADGKVNVQDATLSLRISVGLLQPSDAQKLADDYNNDGKLNIQDTTLILKKAVGL